MASNRPGPSASAPQHEQSFKTYDTAHYAIDYDDHKRPELRKLVRDRTGRQEPGNLSRQHYIDILEDDYIRKATFKFLDLPAELRDLIYVELLTIRKKPKPRVVSPARTVFCFPAILRVSRVVHKETWDILYRANTAEILISNYPDFPTLLHAPRPNLSPRYAKLLSEAILLRAEFFHKVQSRIELNAREHERSRTLPELSSRLRRFKHVSFTIDTNIDGYLGKRDINAKEKARLVNLGHTLHALASSLRTSQKLKAITLEIKWPVKPEELSRRDEMLAKALWPVSLITNCEKVTFIGINEQLAGSLKPIHIGERRTSDPLVYMSELVKKREAIVETVARDLARDFRAYEYDRIDKSVLSGTEYMNADSLTEMEKEIQQLESDVGGGLCENIRQCAASKRQDEENQGEDDDEE